MFGWCNSALKKAGNCQKNALIWTYGGPLHMSYPVCIWHEMKYAFIILKKKIIHHMSKDLSSMESKYDFQIDKLIGYRCLTGQFNQNFCIDMLLLSYNKH